MRKLKLISLLMASLLLFTGCANKTALSPSLTPQAEQAKEPFCEGFGECGAMIIVAPLAAGALLYQLPGAIIGATVEGTKNGLEKLSQRNESSDGGRD